MKKTLLISIIILCYVNFINAQDSFTYPTNFKFPKIKKQSKNIKDFIPKNWKVIDKTFGKLNKDSTKDVVLILKADYAEFLNDNKEGLGVKLFDTNPRMLLILFKKKNGYKLATKSTTFIIGRKYPAMSEPFVNVSLKDRVIKFDFEHWQSAGGWAAWNNTYKFRLQNGRFKMIGADHYYYVRNSGETELRSYNFLTRRMKIVTGSYSDDSVENKVIWKRFHFKQRKTFHDFIPFTWKIEQDKHI